MTPSWPSVVRTVVQPIAGALPALVLVVFAGLLGVLGLAFDDGRRRYALSYAEKFVRLASVLIGAQTPAALPACRGR